MPGGQPGHNNIIDIPPGAYIHLGIKEGILHKLNQNTLTQNIDILPLAINIDGLPLNKSSNSQFWPVLMSIDLIEVSHLFIVGIYHGMRKPKSATQFLDAFVCKRIFAIKRNPELNAMLRTNESFRLQLQQEHHKGFTPLSKIDIGLVSNVPLDYMHLICLSVTRKLILFWVGKKGKFKLKDSNIDAISKKTLIFRKYICISGIKKVHIREPIASHTRLQICLRYLASGDSMRSIGYAFRVSPNTVSMIVHETCSVIWEKLKEIPSVHNNETHLYFDQLMELLNHLVYTQ
ncbi:hypothetical protein X777_06955 [Ooceraea biroi]|uniref:Transposase Helix-turn-helix domain-containing protein n=1 Tax=Ooceraea biroi TaxID=2015173 RepID=A0A026WBR5_OOCBI|nr:hypothetical protein X777_06955 [Ooceraea biroi]